MTPVPLGVPEVLPNLNTGAVDVITAPALAAEQLQWASRLDTINTQVVAATIGALVFTKAKLELARGSAGHHARHRQGRRGGAHHAHSQRGPAAFGRLQSKMTVSTSTDAQLAEWAEIFKQTRARLAQGTFPKDLVEKAESLAQ